MIKHCDGIYPSQMDSPCNRPVMQSFDVFIVVSLNKLLNKQISWQLIHMTWWPFDITVMFMNDKILTDFFPSMLHLASGEDD